MCLLRIDIGAYIKTDLILNSGEHNGSIPYIPSEMLRGNEFTREGDIDGIIHEIVTAQRPFADQAHLIIDICNGIRQKIPDFMLNWIPEWYLKLMYRW
ncbi:7849_t:CDS:2 [Diversispora eburnea]|uniref:7849_t:CDS:1 n=1 Tax=Diversispora eburnea TaxID=1213867 RepID=A0A9N9F723_9GLOM|nr:7849_t:CDS:2 [Diversispora eburnea]